MRWTRIKLQADEAYHWIGQAIDMVETRVKDIKRSFNATSARKITLDPS
jgi:hypothetical protein